MTVQEFFKNDRYAAFSGVELLEVEPGHAKTKMEIRDMHLNAGNVVQGGAIFTLADLAFAAAVNAYGNLAMSIETSIRYFKGIGAGTLYAEAKIVHLHKKLATFEVIVTNEDEELIALFTATAYRKDIPLNLKKMKIEIRTTADGSPTLFLPEMDEHYHSVNGAVRESKHVYIEAGFKQCRKSEIHVLEMGFGTGLNVLLTALEAENQKINVFYTGLEKFPLLAEITDRLNYAETSLFHAIHQAEWEKLEPVNPYLQLKKIRTDFKDFNFPDKYDIVYYDAFAPDKQPDVWSSELFNKIFSSMNRGGILTTYCAKGSIRRMMQQAGFTVERIPGPPGKREMLRGSV